MPTRNLEVVPVGDPPEDLGEAEKRWWRVLGEEVDLLAIFTAADRTSFRNMVRMQALLEGAHNGTVVERSRDGEIRDVGITGIVQLTRALASMLVRFGLDPSSRDRLPPRQAPPGAASDDPDHFKPIQ